MWTELGKAIEGGADEDLVFVTAKPCYWVSKLIQTEARDLADGLAGARCHWTTAGTYPLQMAVAWAEGGTSEIVKMLEAALKSEQV